MVGLNHAIFFAKLTKKIEDFSLVTKKHLYFFAAPLFAAPR